MDEIMESFDLDHDGLLGAEEVQYLLDRCFGKGQFTAAAVLAVLGHNKRGISREDLHELFNMWTRLQANGL